MLIAMFLEPGTISPKLRLYRGQGTIQLILILLAAVCVPWLLISKPYLVWKEMQKTQGQGYRTIGHGDDGHEHDIDDEEEGNGHAVDDGDEQVR